MYQCQHPGVGGSLKKRMEIGSSQIWLALAMSYLVERELAWTLEKLLARRGNVVKITFR